MTGGDQSEELLAQARQFVESRMPFAIVGGNSKSFYGLPSAATATLHTSGHRGIASYEPSECVVTVRSGTPVTELTRILAENGQMLGFDPPQFNKNSTMGGTVACGLSGPRRPYAGSVRDAILGCTIVNGKAERLRFGGQVMKNVAGFDVSRLMAGAMGQLGVLLEISFRVVPIPEAEITLSQTVSSQAQALAVMAQRQREAWPISALAYFGNRLMIRLAGAESAIMTAARRLGGEVVQDGARFWQQLRDQQLDFFAAPVPLWRIAIAPAAPTPEIEGEYLLDWGGAQRWLKSAVCAQDIHAIVQSKGGHAVCFKGSYKNDWLRLEQGVLVLHRKVKSAFDPYGLINPQRILPEL